MSLYYHVLLFVGRPYAWLGERIKAGGSPLWYVLWNPFNDYYAPLLDRAIRKRQEALRGEFVYDFDQDTG